MSFVNVKLYPLEKPQNSLGKSMCVQHAYKYVSNLANVYIKKFLCISYVLVGIDFVFYVYSTSFF